MSVPQAALADDVTELLILWPHLAGALERDQGVADEERVTGGDGTFGLPVNADVLDALRILGRDVPRLARWAADVLAEPAPVRTLDTMLRHLPRMHERMLVTAATEEAAQLARGVRRVLRHVKIALGLRTLDRGLQQFCPLHDEVLFELIAPGAEAVLRYSRLDRAGRPVVPGVEWRRSDCALCRHCGAVWTPGEYLLLGRLLRAADMRRTAADIEALGAE